MINWRIHQIEQVFLSNLYDKALVLVYAMPLDIRNYFSFMILFMVRIFIKFISNDVSLISNNGVIGPKLDWWGWRGE